MPLRRGYYSEVLAAARSTMYVSAALRDTAIGLGAPPDNTHVVPNGVDLSVFTPGPADRSPRMLFVGGLAPIKGADRLPEILEKVLQRVPSAELDVVGVGALRPELEAAAQRLPIRLHGALPRADVARMMGEASVLLVPSRNEGFGCVVLEAYACGTPVVASCVGGLPESVGAEGALVPDDAALLDGIAHHAANVLHGTTDRAPLLERAARSSWHHVAQAELDALGLTAG
ncbi:hypothetical protein BJF82_03245 [Kytococcus sp. CUA-901]|nr:hypothetical protein BJF82_03245 [Kytococcus sp. CUA-901]